MAGNAPRAQNRTWHTRRLPAMRLARYFGNSARIWLNLQTAYGG